MSAFIGHGAKHSCHVWQDYVAGTDPTDLNSRFSAAIAISNDVPYITWSPNLNTNGVVRKYTILGKERLTDTAAMLPFAARAEKANVFFMHGVSSPWRVICGIIRA